MASKKPKIVHRWLFGHHFGETADTREPFVYAIYEVHMSDGSMRTERVQTLFAGANPDLWDRLRAMLSLLVVVDRECAKSDGPRGDCGKG